MLQQMILTLVFILLLVIIYIINGRKTSKKNNLPNRYDLIIKFEQSHYRDIRNLEVFNDIASWQKYGKSGFRGFSILNKEELEDFIEDKLDIDKSMFHVISTTGMYIPS